MSYCCFFSKDPLLTKKAGVFSNRFPRLNSLVVYTNSRLVPSLSSGRKKVDVAERGAVTIIFVQEEHILTLLPTTLDYIFRTLAHTHTLFQIQIQSSNSSSTATIHVNTSGAKILRIIRKASSPIGHPTPFNHSTI